VHAILHKNIKKLAIEFFCRKLIEIVENCIDLCIEQPLEVKIVLRFFPNSKFPNSKFSNVTLPKIDQNPNFRKDKSSTRYLFEMSLVRIPCFRTVKLSTNFVRIFFEFCSNCRTNLTFLGCSF
jgi:hypothetical protein